MIPLGPVRTVIARLSPDPVCDGCVADRLGLASRQRANSATRELAGRGGFERYQDICSLCFSERVVTRRRAMPDPPAPL